MTKKKANKRSDELIDELLGKYGTSPEAVLGEKGLFMDLKRRIVERALAQPQRGWNVGKEVVERRQTQEVEHVDHFFRGMG